MSTVSLQGLRKSFGSVKALDGIDLRVEDGEHVAILGPSGSGKSTLLRVVAGLESVDSGSVEVGGVPQDGIPAHRRDIAIVFQHFALYPHLSSLENITLGLRHGLGLPKKEAEARAHDIATRMQVQHLLARKPKEMSGGQRQRIALARALARRSGIVLLDEPLSGLDAQLHAVLRLEIASLLRSIGATGLNVTHDQLDAMAMADRIAVIHQGRIEQLGTPDELYAEPATLFVAGFIGTPPMNLISVDPVASTSLFGRHSGIDGPVTFGIRAEHLQLGTASDAGRAWTIEGEVVLLEPTGKDRVVHLLCSDGSTVALRCDVADSPHVGQKVTVLCAPEDIHAYASDSGRRLGSVVSEDIAVASQVVAA